MKVLVFSPHPDDAEVLMGGTIAKYTQNGHEVLIIVVTVPNHGDKREKESEKSAAILGAGLSILDINPHELAFNRKTVEIFDDVIKNFPPDVIYTSWLHDSHQDHISVCEATIAAARKNRCSLYMYEQALPSGFTPYAFRAQVFVDISDTIETKIKSVLAHQSQVQNFTEQWIQGIKARATYTGFQINVQYAEAFEVVKEIKQI
ncbi:MAG: PIG-L family deacetylase [Dehalococcoidales bacterium]|nr:PIG-L family deacetylase [Dehalococcoidales bacterium]